jgi:hypothetical protein
MTSARPVGFYARMRMRIAKRERRFAGHHVYSEHLGYSGVFSVIGVLGVLSAPTSACGSRRARGASRGLQAAPHRTAPHRAASQWLAYGKESRLRAFEREARFGPEALRGATASAADARGLCTPSGIRFAATAHGSAHVGCPPGGGGVRAEAGGCRRVRGGVAGRSGPQGGLECFLR